jgi:hypothetical protein
MMLARSRRLTSRETPGIAATRWPTSPVQPPRSLTFAASPLKSTEQGNWDVVGDKPVQADDGNGAEWTVRSIR